MAETARNSEGAGQQAAMKDRGNTTWESRFRRL